MSDRSGRIPLPPNRVFFWYQPHEGAEIQGHLEDMEGRIVSHTFGWWRTTNEEEAAKRAALAFDLEYDPEWRRFTEQPKKSYTVQS